MKTEQEKYELMTKEVEERLKSKAFDWAEKNGVDNGEMAVFVQQVTFKAVDDDEVDGVKIIGNLSTIGNVDRERDVVRDGAFDESLKEFRKLGKLPLLKDHRAKIDSQIGSFTKLKVVGKELQFEAFIVRDEISEHALKLIKNGDLNTVSMGGIFKFANEGQSDNRDRFFIEKVMLFEGSIVPIPANPKATFTQKSLQSEAENPDPVEEPSSDSNEKAVPTTHREKMIDAMKLIREGK